MEKLDMQTPNIADKNFEALSKMFPNAITETIDENGEVVRAIDADILRQEISCKVVEGKDERYQFTWPDKKQSAAQVNIPISSTLRPCYEDSIEFDSTENIYIEGDNIDVLKLLQETYLNKIKMIYIDPPYNTGEDFIYSDDYSISQEDYKLISNNYDDNGNRLFLNNENNGRFHTDWLNMIYSRLKLARNLLCEEGIIFISIDDWEEQNMKKICDEIFGERNMINHRCFINSIPNGTNKGLIARAHEYILAYAKDIDKISPFIRRGEDESISVERCTNTPTQKNPKSSIIFPKGLNFDGDEAEFTGIIGDKEPIEIVGKMTFRNGKLENDVELISNWRNKAQIQTFFKNGKAFDESGQEVFEVFFTKEGKPKYKKRLTCISPKSVQQFKSYSYESEFADLSFENPKPVSLVEFLVSLCCSGNDIVLDFFAGSATTANAVLEVNKKNNEHIRYILVQIDEDLKKSVEKKSGRALTYTQNMISALENVGRKPILSEVGKERIFRLNSMFENIDSGCRMFKIDSSNMKEVFYRPADTQQTLLDMFADNIKEDRTPEDLLFQVMLDLGVLLSSKIEETEIAGKKVFNVADGFLIACFDKDVTDETIKAVANMKPYYAVFRDSSMANDSVATNFDQIFANISSDTIRKVL